jgi:hypothetical protein
MTVHNGNKNLFSAMLSMIITYFATGIAREAATVALFWGIIVED